MSSFSATQHSWLHTPLVDILNCTFPILNAGMGGVARADLAAAVCNAGGFGCLGMVRESPKFIRDQVTQVRAMTTSNFSVNIIPAATEEALLEEQVDCLIELAIPVISLFWDVNQRIVRRFVDAGIKVLHQVGNTSDARLALDSGVDALIAQGVEAGGHIHGKISTHAIVQDMVGFSTVPVIASGGISTGQQLVSMMALGAQGVSLGTLFLATNESYAHQFHKQKIAISNAEDTLLTTAFYINWPHDATTRVIKNSVTENSNPIKPHNNEKLQQIGTQDGKPIYLNSTDSPLQNANGNLEKMALYSGQSCNTITRISSVSTVFKQLLTEALGCASMFNSTTKFNAGHPTHDTHTGIETTDNKNNLGYLSQTETYELLSDLLRAERAGAKICTTSLKHTTDSVLRDIYESIHQDEVESCQKLIEAIHSLGLPVHTNIGDFYEKCMAVDDPKSRLELLNKGQRWVTRKIKLSLNLINSSSAFNALNEILRVHEENVQKLEQDIVIAFPDQHFS